MPKVTENYIKTYIHMYGILPLIYLIKKFEDVEEYEKCNVIFNTLNKYVIEFKIGNNIEVNPDYNTFEIYIDHALNYGKIINKSKIDRYEYIKLAAYYSNIIYKELNLSGLELIIFELSESLIYGDIYFDDNNVIFWTYTSILGKNIEEAMRVDSEIIKKYGHDIFDEKFSERSVSFKIILKK